MSYNATLSLVASKTIFAVFEMRRIPIATSLFVFRLLVQCMVIAAVAVFKIEELLFGRECGMSVIVCDCYISLAFLNQWYIYIVNH